MRKIRGDELTWGEYLQFIGWLEKSWKIKKDEKRINFAYDFLDVAVYDLKAGKLLYENGIYPLSLFHIQQSVEKLAKAWFILVSDEDLDEIKKKLAGRNGIGHISPEAFLKLLKNEIDSEIEGMSDEEKAKKKKIYEKSKNEIEKDISVNPETLNLSGIKATEEIFKTTAKIAAGIMQEIARNMEIFKPISQYYGAPQKPHNENSESEVEIPEVEETYCKFGIKTAILYKLSIYTFKHEQTTRYPDSELKPSDYRLGMDIVDALPKMFEELDDIIKVFETQFLYLQEADP